jgi:hypothetical protein
MVIIKEIDSAGSGKVLLIILGSMGFVFGFLTTLATFVGAPMPKKAGIFSLLFGKSAVFTLTLFYGLSGYFIGLIASRLYNTFVGSKKGFRVEVSR